MLTIKVVYKNDFHVVAGPSNKQGEIEITRNAMEAEIKETANHSIMDYGGAASFSGDIVLSPMSQDRIERALEAHRQFSGYGYSYPATYQQDLQRAWTYLDQHNPKRLSVTATISPSASAIRLTTEDILLEQENA